MLLQGNQHGSMRLWGAYVVVLGKLSLTSCHVPMHAAWAPMHLEQEHAVAGDIWGLCRV